LDIAQVVPVDCHVVR